MAPSTEIIYYPPDGNTSTFAVEEDSYWYRHRNNMIVAAYQKFCRSNQLFADIGGGNGAVALALQDAGVLVLMIEPYAAGVNNAKKRGVEFTFNGALSDLDRSMGFHNAGLFDVVEHLPDDRAAIRDVWQKIPVGGMLFVTVPAFQSLFSEADVELGHFRRYSNKQLKLLLESEGFSVLYCTYFFSILFLPMLIFRKMFARRKQEGRNRRKTEHAQNRKWLNKLLYRFLTYEKLFIQINAGLPFGSSCLAVAVKKNTA